MLHHFDEPMYIQFESGVSGRGRMSGTIDSELRRDGTMEIAETFNATLHSVLLNDFDGRTAFGRLAIEVPSWLTQFDTVTELFRTPEGQYQGQIEHAPVPALVVREIQSVQQGREELGAEGLRHGGSGSPSSPRASGRRTVVTPDNVLVTRQFADVIANVAEVRSYIEQYIAREEPTQYERALLRVLQEELDVIADRIDEIVVGPDTTVADVARQPRVQEALVYLKKCLAASKDVAPVVVIAEKLKDILSIFG